MPIRLFPPVALAVLLVLAVPAPAHATGATLRAPEDGVVRGAETLRVQLRNDVTDVLDRVEVSLRRNEGEFDDGLRHTLCDSREVCSRPEAEYGIEFDPRTGAPFVDHPRTLPNGAYVLRVTLTRPGTERRDTLDLALTVSVPPAAPGDVDGYGDGEDVVLGWRGGTEPDLLGYRVDRRLDGEWTPVAELAVDTTSFLDRPGHGTHDYRIVSLRADGRGATFEAASPAVAVTVDGRPADEVLDTPAIDAADDEEAGSTARERARRDRTPATAPALGGTAPIPALTEPRRDEADTAAVGDGYEDTLDYGDRGDQSAAAPGEEATVAAPGTTPASRWQAPQGGLVPGLAGLAVIAFGWGLRRWMRVPGT